LNVSEHETRIGMEKKTPTVKTIQWNKKRESKRFKTEEAAVIYIENDMTSLMAKVTNLSETGASLDVKFKRTDAKSWRHS